jgi:hypothetical protein
VIPKGLAKAPTRWVRSYPFGEGDIKVFRWGSRGVVGGAL